MNNAIISIVKNLNSENVIVGSGFMIGFMYDFKFNKKTLDNPLSTILNSLIGGFFCSLGASIVGSIIPYPYRMIIPCVATASCIKYKYDDFKNNKK